MTLNPAPREALPVGLATQLLPSELVFYFSYISYKGGCLSSSSKDEHWIALTNKRVLYKAKVTETEKTIEKEGVLPIDKISFIEVTDVRETKGCNSVQYYALRISTSGGTIVLPVPTRDKGNEIRNTFQHIIEELNIKLQ
ncbi:MAG: hypothetical protein WC379_06210 [Methanoregula sp.]|jgi:hypothetical protein